MTSSHISLMYWVAQLPIFHRKPAPPAPRPRAARPTVMYTPTEGTSLQTGRGRRHILDPDQVIERMNREYRLWKHPDHGKHATLQMHREGGRA